MKNRIKKADLAVRGGQRRTQAQGGTDRTHGDRRVPSAAAQLRAEGETGRTLL